MKAKPKEISIGEKSKKKHLIKRFPSVKKLYFFFKSVKNMREMIVNLF